MLGNVKPSRVRKVFSQPYLPAYLAGWLATTAWLAGITMSIGEVGFTFVAHGLNTLGFGVSLGLRYAVDREQGEWLWRRVINPSVFFRLLILLFVVLPGFAKLPGFQVLFPPAAQDVEELMIGALFVWGHILFSFTMISESLVLFASVAGIASFGLVSTVNVNPSLIVAFLLFILGNLFLAGYVTLLRHSSGSLPVLPAQEGLSSFQKLLRLTTDHFIMSVLLLAGTVIGGVLMALILPLVSPRVIPLAWARIQLPDWYYQAVGNYTGFLPSFRIGTGPVPLDKTPVMRVQCERELLWRGAVYDKYTGSSWEQTQTTGYPALKGEGNSYEMDRNIQSLSELAPRPRVVQRIRVEKQLPQVLFGAAEPVRVQGKLGPVSQTSYGTIYTSWKIFPGRVYVVESAIPNDFIADELRNAGSRYPPEIEQQYRPALPFGAERIHELSLKVIAGATTPYDRARAIQEYLEENYVYGDISPIPMGEDGASYFLFHTKQGVCDLFATAMVLMAREAGIPARVATGFAPGQEDPQRREYVVTYNDAHAWAELFFPGFGWVPFDPQARRRAGLMTSLTSWLDDRKSPFRSFAQPSLFFLTLAGLTLALVYFALRPSWRVRRKTPAPHDHRGHIVRLYHQMCRLLRSYGYERRPHQTPREYLTFLEEVIPLDSGLHGALENLTHLFHTARYSQAPITAAERQQTRQLWTTFRRQIRQWKRR